MFCLLLVQRRQSRDGVVIEFFVVTPKGKSITIKASTDDTIDIVKAFVRMKSGIPRCKQILAFAGNDLDDAETLSHYNVQANSRIDLKMRVLGAAKKIMKDDKMAMSKAKLEQCMRLVRSHVVLKDDLVTKSDAIVRTFFNEQDPDYLKNRLRTMSVAKLEEIYDNSNITGDPDTSLVKMAPNFIDQISEIDIVVQNLTNVKTCLVKGFVMQYGLEFFVKNQYEHTKFYTEIQEVIKAKNTKSNEDLVAEAIKIREVEIRRALEEEYLEKMKQMKAAGDSFMAD